MVRPSSGTSAGRSGVRWSSVAPTLVIIALLGVGISKSVVDEPVMTAQEAEAQMTQLAGEMVALPGGSYQMGSSGGGWYDNEKPAHAVTVPAFRMGRHEVTVGQFRQFVKATRYRTDAERNADGKRGCRIFTGDGADWTPGGSWRNPGFPVSDDQPVVCVSWNDTQAFIAWLTEQTGESYRLPSEAEWEYAARAGSAAKYHFGDNESLLCRYGNHADTSSDLAWHNESCSDGVGEQTANVGRYRPNGFGLHDMHGNVWEWVQDCYNDRYFAYYYKRRSYRNSLRDLGGGLVQDSYDDSSLRAPDDGRAWLEGHCNWRVIRGGGWISPPRDLRSALRNWNARPYRLNALGFRLVQDVYAPGE